MKETLCTQTACEILRQINSRPLIGQGIWGRLSGLDIRRRWRAGFWKCRRGSGRHLSADVLPGAYSKKANNERIPGGIPPDTMPHPQTNIRLEPALKEAAQARADAMGVSLSKLVEQALQAYLAADTTAVPPDTTRGELAAIVNRLERLESLLIPGDTTPHQPNKSVREHQPNPDAKMHPNNSGSMLADGVSLLTTQQAYAKAQLRGYTGSFAAFRSWAKRNPEKLRELGLVRTGYQGRSNTMASFEDLKSPS